MVEMKEEIYTLKSIWGKRIIVYGETIISFCFFIYYYFFGKRRKVMTSMKAKLSLLIGAVLSMLAIIFKENIGNATFYILIVIAIIILITACIMEKGSKDK